MLSHLINFLKANVSQEFRLNPNTPGTLNQSRSLRANQKKRIESGNSDKYFYILFCLVLVVNIRTDLYFSVAIIVLIWKIVKFCIFNLYKFVIELNNFEVYKKVVTDWLDLRSDVLMPKPFILLLRLFIKGDHRVNQWLQKSMDKIVSGLMIMFLLLFILLAFGVLAMQVYNFLQLVFRDLD